MTNEFVAIFELVKNSFDAGASKVDIEFDPQKDTISISDDGHGMSEKDIIEKWLFVAYSEKAQTSSVSYRDKIKSGGQFAGSKGIGRFACDTLGTRLDLYTKTETSTVVSHLNVDWTQFETDSLEEFHQIKVDISSKSSFPTLVYADEPVSNGTVLVIKNTRHVWDREAISKLRRDLAKLIDPFGTTKNVSVSTWLVDGGKYLIDNVDGLVGNAIADLLKDKTSRIHVCIDDEEITTNLYDRGRKIYEIKEPSPYVDLKGAKVEGQIYYLNRSAKHTFTNRMGVRPVEFGSVFLFLNGFRVFPIGEEFDDSFGLNRRKQQGQARYLGTRDVLGRVDITARAKMFREVSSRDAGLIEDAHSRDLFDAITKHMILRLERYVVGVNWKDKADGNRDTSEGLETDRARERIQALVGSMAKSKDIRIIYYDEDIVRVSENPDQLTDDSLKVMADLAANRGDSELLKQVEQARRRIEELKQSREEAQKEARRALEERLRTDARIERLEQRAAFLGSSLDIDIDRVQLLMHQATIHVGHIRSALANAAHEIRLLQLSAEIESDEILPDDFDDVLASIRQSARRISSSLAGASLSGDRLKSVLSFAPNIRVDLDTDVVQGDLVKFLKEYFEVRLSGVPDMPEAIFSANGTSLIREFSPVDISVLIDNLIDNARKARATKVEFLVKPKSPNSLTIVVTDDGAGIDDRKVDPSMIFERGYTGSRQGTGLGLYNARRLLEIMEGTIELVGDGSRADFEITLKGEVHES
ncbi:sensor histidine kinase [Brucella rhizosphaerae]|uniref:sensor histidine kinase n=1 Tax=Brucella rhizosphaerae TaxID=571254 RepID=UPI001F1E56A8|nr:sensor histidine kinase [Brucella rhizosphaerae]